MGNTKVAYIALGFRWVSVDRSVVILILKQL